MADDLGIAEILAFRRFGTVAIATTHVGVVPGRAVNTRALQAVNARENQSCAPWLLMAALEHKRQRETALLPLTCDFRVVVVHLAVIAASQAFDGKV
jgi:hypothetical protein